MKIFVDYDSTLNDMSYAWVAWINKTYGVEFTDKDVTHWEWYKDLPHDAFKWFKDGVAFNEILPLPDSQEFFKDINKNHEVKILTASHANMLEPKNEHILKYYGTCDVIHEHKKWKHAVDITTLLIDDRPLNCIKWVEAGGVAILFNHDGRYEYANTAYKHALLLKVRSYEEIKLILEEIE